MRVFWTPEAELDRESILSYIAGDNPQAADRMDEMFDSAAKLLGRFPEAGHSGQLPGTREWIPHKSYRMVYEIEEDTV